MCPLRSAVCNFRGIFNKPPGFLYDNSAFLTLYPVDRLLFPNINPERDIIYELFTSKNPTEPQILVPGNDSSIQASNLTLSNPTVIYFHGFLEGTTYGSSKLIKEAYMKRGDHNLILVNAQLLAAGPWYMIAYRNVKAIGRYTAAFIDYLVSQGLELNKVHLIGHSLGSHMAGFCGQYVTSGKIPRITGLDPAKPFFTRAASNRRLDKSQAEFVDVIHTACDSFGLTQPIGHADFYPNGGKDQPGCSIMDIRRKKKYSILEIVFSSHWRSVYFYAESVTNPNSFKSYEASNWNDYLTDKFNRENSTNMGFGADTKARGKYFLQTSRNKPYSLS